MKEMIEELFQYAVTVRRQLHEYPEVGFDLEHTTELVAGELEKMGIPYSREYGVCSLVADLGQGEKRIALRADMDALPVEEKTELPFRSKIPGAMHACGHDAHTAILLAVAKYLKAREKELPCRVRLIFQPSEEGAVSGAKMMVDNGVMDGVSQVLCTHCDNDFDSGKIGTHPGDYMAACIPLNITFLGRTAHAALAEYGIDAVAMAVEAYGAMKEMVTREAGDRVYVWSVGRFSGGHVHNVVADRCEMDISFRFYDMDFAKRVELQAKQICEEIARKKGGKVQIRWEMSTGPVYNDPAITERFEKAARDAGLTLTEIPLRKSSEDFGWYLGKAPGMIFRFGTRNEALGCTALAHRNDFCIDEAGMKPAIKAFCAYVFSCAEM